MNDWQLRVALVIAGALLIAYIYFDYKKKKKRKQENEKLKKQYGDLSDTVDGAGFDMTGVGSPRLAKGKEEGESSQSNCDGVDEIELAELKGSTIESFINETNNQQHDEVGDVAGNRQPAPLKETQSGEFDNSVSEEAPEETTRTPSDDLFSSEQSNQQLETKPALVLSLILQANDGESFKGKDFLPIFLSQGLRHGEMDIFHRRIMKGKKLGPVLFSLANGIAPGTFNISEIDSFETPALALFMTMPGPEDAQVAYDAMYKTTKLLKQELGGEILDESKSNYTVQTHNHRLDQIQDYNRQLS
jgi:cell division protein ZipA